MNMEKISVIVPVYKVEPYLRQCLDSILAQTYQNFELILVDDGSPDNCGAICDEYAEKDSRITVIHQENGGLSAARNAGLDWMFANSDSGWLTFVDSDDVLAPIMLETLYKEAVKHQADIAITRSVAFFDDDQLEKEGKYVGQTTCADGKTLLISFYNGEAPFAVVSWGKLIRRRLYQSLRFPVGKIHEDEATTPILIYNAEWVAVIRAQLYFYRQREESIMNTAFSVKRFDAVDAYRSCTSYFAEHEGGVIAKLAKRYQNDLWAGMTCKARREGIYAQVPAQYRMSLIRAFSTIFVNSLRRGGVRLVMERINNLLKQFRK